MATDETKVEWRKARASANSGGCLEIAAIDAGGFLVRNSRQPELGPLTVTQHELNCFLDGAKAGEFDDLASP